jgi:hypothetical protein
VVIVLLQLFCAPAFSQSSSGKQVKTISRTYGFAGILADLGIYYSRSEATATPAANNTWESSTSVYDVKLGYIDESHLYYGAIYTSRGDNQLSLNQTSGSSVGVGLGYFGYNGFNLRGYYKFNDVFGQYEDGTGYQFDLGYAINPTSSFYAGLNVSFRETTYKTNNSIAAFQSWARKETYPFITFGFLFF